VTSHSSADDEVRHEYDFRDVVDDHLVIIPDREAGDVVVRGNEILVGERRLVFQLAGAV